MEPCPPPHPQPVDRVGSSCPSRWACPRPTQLRGDPKANPRRDHRTPACSSTTTPNGSPPAKRTLTPHTNRVVVTITVAPSWWRESPACTSAGSVVLPTFVWAALGDVDDYVEPFAGHARCSSNEPRRTPLRRRTRRHDGERRQPRALRTFGGPSPRTPNRSPARQLASKQE